MADFNVIARIGLRRPDHCRSSRRRLPGGTWLLFASRRVRVFISLPLQRAADSVFSGTSFPSRSRVIVSTYRPGRTE